MIVRQVDLTSNQFKKQDKKQISMADQLAVLFNHIVPLFIADNKHLTT